MFLKPFEQYRPVQTFYADEWTSRRSSSRVRKIYESQSALIASEHIVCGNLPGNHSGKLFMTEPHRWELFGRIDEHMSEMREAAGRRSDEMKVAWRKRLKAVSGLTMTNPPEVTRRASSRRAAGGSNRLCAG